MTVSLARLSRFVRTYWMWALAAPAVAVFGTIVHEFFHAIAVWLQGGTVTRFVWLPDGSGRMGWISYRGDLNPSIVGLAPSLGWMIVVVIARLRAPRQPGRVARWWLVLAWLLPVLDLSLAMSVLGASLGRGELNGDLALSLPAATQWPVLLLGISFIVTAIAVSPMVFRRAFPVGTLSRIEIAACHGLLWSGTVMMTVLLR